MAMTCDICNSPIAANPAALLTTKEVVTSKDCWVLYLGALLKDGAMTVDEMREGLTVLAGQMACSDTPWALCDSCHAGLLGRGFRFQIRQVPLPKSGHALCNLNMADGKLEFVQFDDGGMLQALGAAHAAVAEVLSPPC